MRVLLLVGTLQGPEAGPQDEYTVQCGTSRAMGAHVYNKETFSVAINLLVCE